MKKIMCIAIFIAAVMLLLPLSVLKESPQAVAASTTVLPQTAELEINPSETFRLYNSSSGEITEINKADYIFGVVAAEMPALYNEEALKAQAVAAYTFACRRKAENSDKAYDISDNPNTDQNYITEQTARERWGDNAEEYVNKIKNAVSFTDGYMITYNNEPITAVYHAVSSGKTEACKDIWGTDLPYLQSVASEGDKLANDYITKVSFTADELKQKLSEKIESTAEPATFFGECTRTDSGTVKTINICSNSVDGSEVRSLLGLRSSNFEVSFTENVFTFTVYGYGHGVGMSQNGANFMAQQGSDFKEILCHYYTGCSVDIVKN